MISEDLRDQLPADLQGAEIVGGEVADLEDSVRLYGPPGSGKSTQASLRTGARALRDHYLKPGIMTVVTYRKALASVVRQRLIDWGVFTDPEDVPPGSASKDNPFRYWNTIHATASRATGFMELLDDDPENEIGGMVNYRTEYEFCSEMSIRRDPEQPWEDTKWTVFKDLYDYAKRNLLDAGEYRWIDSSNFPSLRANLAAERRLQEFDKLWGGVSFEAVAQRWEEFKADYNAYDFHEQLEYALVGDLPPLGHLVVDEYHDATPLMAKVTERWIDNANVAIVAADPDQVVNQYAGASPEFYEKLPKRVEKPLPEVQLEKSWRCPDEHFQAAARVLREERRPPELETAGPGKIHRWFAKGFEFDPDAGKWRLPPADADGEPVWLWRNVGPDVMYLTRTQRQADAVAAAFDRAGIIYESQSSVGGDWEYRTALLNALAVVEDRTPTDLGRRQLSQKQARLLAEHSAQTYLSERLGRIQRKIREEHTTGVPLRAWESWVTPRWWKRYARGRGSIAELTKRGELSDRDLAAMTAAWARHEPPFEAETETRVLTIHASKGAEASDVVVYDGITSSVRDGMEESDALRENEARTWYVALTRASKRLHIIRNGWDWTEPYLPEDLEPRAAKAAEEYREVNA